MRILSGTDTVRIVTNRLGTTCTISIIYYSCNTDLFSSVDQMAVNGFQSPTRIGVHKWHHYQSGNHQIDKSVVETGIVYCPDPQSHVSWRQKPWNRCGHSGIGIGAVRPLYSSIVGTSLSPDRASSDPTCTGAHLGQV